MDAKQQDEKAWYRLPFPIKWIGDNHALKAIHTIDSPLHPLLANEILVPILSSFGDNGDAIYPWRFHRLFWQENKQHEFTFRFCAPKTSNIPHELLQAIIANPVYKEIKQHDILDLKSKEDVTLSEKGPDGDTSWPDEVNKCWPHFICGVSRAWAELISLFADKEFENAASCLGLHERLNLYVKVNEHIKNSWAIFGQHAMLHHLTGVFGYNPVLVKVGPHYGLGSLQKLACTHVESLQPNMLPFISDIAALLTF